MSKFLIEKKTLSIALLLSLITTIASSAINSEVTATYADIMGCESGCSVVAAGWPFPYLVDYPAISPVGSVSLLNGFLGIDRIWIIQLFESFFVWFIFIGIAIWILKFSLRKKI